MKLCRALGAKTVAWTVRSPEEYADAGKRYDCIIGENIPEMYFHAENLDNVSNE